MSNNASQQGFTLVEVLVSLLIFSTAILGLMHAGTQNLNAVYVAEQKQIAGIIADNQLILALHTELEISAGTQKDSVDMDGRIWNWQILIKKTPQAGFYQLDIIVREQGSEQIIVSRTAYAQGRL
ncbi:MAG: type II secretion system protein GspI [Robiginitomaculum sp.]|nr:MAG: type II secretion system protein GspI [Robiginitomaculum sp.]